MKAVLDIGKTNVKLQLVDSEGHPCQSYSLKNTPLNLPPYPHADVSAIWQWLLATLSGYEKSAEITDLIVTTHGATAALVNSTMAEDGLVLPVLDYEYTGINDCDSAYSEVRPAFAETYSPNLPAGLNLGRQLFWQQREFPDAFAQADVLLMYPQYWGWRLTGELAGEVTSLGCHTDLWAPKARSYSSLVASCGWAKLMPSLKSAWQCLGTIKPALAQQLGLSQHCKVYVGLHDSNASYLRYLLQGPGASEHKKQVAFTVVSTGTWTILMQANGALGALKAERDMLANCDIFANPVACARFMGGREYDAICQRLGGNVTAPVAAEDIDLALENFWMVTPDFSAGNGPFGGLTPVISFGDGTPSHTCASAVATLYCALMIDQRLTDLGATGAVYIEGAFLKNPLLCQLVAQLRRQQKVYLSADDTGTVQGAIALTNYSQVRLEPSASASLALQVCPASSFTGLGAYRARWYEIIAQAQAQA